MKRNVAATAILLRDALEALIPFAERPGKHIEDYPCHVGYVKDPERCSRCGQAIRAYKILERARALGMAVVA